MHSCMHADKSVYIIRYSTIKGERVINGLKKREINSAFPFVSAQSGLDTGLPIGTHIDEEMEQ